MIPFILSVAVSLVASLVFTSVLIRFLTKHEMGQFIRQDGPESHFTKRGTPTMGGLAIILAVIVGYFAASGWMFFYSGRSPSLSTALIFLLFGGMGLVGFVDDFAKIKNQQSLGLTASKKMLLQGLIGTVFAGVAWFFPDETGFTPAGHAVSFTNDIPALNFEALGSVLGWILFIVWVNLIVTAWTNATNLTDGLDGLATGVSLFAFASYAMICFWQNSHICGLEKIAEPFCYSIRDPWDLTLIAGAITGALFGFLWFNAAPAKIFMGDTGSLALGGAFAGLSILSHTELLAILAGGVFVMETVSVTLQVGFFKWKKRRIFKMAPIHHHFELKGWSESNVVVRFWIISALFAAGAMGVFYAGWLQGVVFG